MPRRVEPVATSTAAVSLTSGKSRASIAKEVERSRCTSEADQRVARAKFGTPRLVRRLDVEGSYYYLVPAIDGVQS